MGGSGGSIRWRYSQREVVNQIEETRDQTATVEYESSINDTLRGLLTQYNERDSAVTQDRLEEIKARLQDHLETAIDLRFGGSVAKHTYVDGLSDVDTLAILPARQWQSSNAGDVLDAFADILRAELGYNAIVDEGRLAVTVTFADGMKIQMLPAIRAGDGIRIPKGNSNDWSAIIRPDAFAKKLTEANQHCNNMLVPVVKLAKGVLATLPESIRPSGYHIESLAIEAFKSFHGPFTHKAMLQHLFDRGSQLVLNPIQDSTGQSLNVDDYLGPSNSATRQNVSGALEGIAKRMTTADAATSSKSWLAAIGE